jgi:hypothetical protein
LHEHELAAPLRLSLEEAGFVDYAVLSYDRSLIPHWQKYNLDQAAAGHLSSQARPWVLGPVKWTPALTRRAVIFLALAAGKALLKLSDDDFREYKLYELLREHGPAERLGRRVFERAAALRIHHHANNGAARFQVIRCNHLFIKLSAIGKLFLA